jgi:hypothetical protein
MRAKLMSSKNRQINFVECEAQFKRAADLNQMKITIASIPFSTMIELSTHTHTQVDVRWRDEMVSITHFFSHALFFRQVMTLTEARS